MTTTPTSSRLTPNALAYAHDSDLAPLWQSVHGRLCAGNKPSSINTLKTALSTAGVATLRDLLDTTPRRRRIKSAVTHSSGVTTVPVRELLGVLQVPPEDLTEFVERATGCAVVNRSLQLRQTNEDLSHLWTYASERLTTTPSLVERMRKAGAREEIGTTRRLIDTLGDALALLPLEPALPLAKLAHDLVGDPHYFDLDTLAGQRLISAVCEAFGLDEPDRPDRTRALLLDVGVIADRLSATVLLHNVLAVGKGEIDRRLNASARPVALTLTDLTLEPPTFGAQTLTVVENPSVLEIAMARGYQGPVACTSGHLGSVDHALLQRALDCGVELRYAGDTDRDGWIIAQSVERWYGATILGRQHDTQLFQENDVMLEWLRGPQ